MSARALAAALVLAIAAPAWAQPKQAAPAQAATARRKVLLAPMAVLGEETRASDLRKVEKLLADGLGAVDVVDLIAPSVAADAARKAGRPELGTCDGQAACLAELGALGGAEQVVYGELGGLGDAQVVYLKLVDVASKTEVRSTTLELGATGRDAEARAGAVRLLAPGRYVGTLVLDVPVAGATVYLDGEKLATSPVKPQKIPVGEHALRVTHPEYRDFVRFIDVPFDATETLSVELVRYDVVDRELAREGGGPIVHQGREEIVAAPWYRRWYTIAGGGAVLLLTSAIVFAAVADGIDADRTHDVR